MQGIKELKWPTITNTTHMTNMDMLSVAIVKSALRLLTTGSTRNKSTAAALASADAVLSANMSANNPRQPFITGVSRRNSKESGNASRLMTALTTARKVANTKHKNLTIVIYQQIYYFISFGTYLHTNFKLKRPSAHLVRCEYTVYTSKETLMSKFSPKICAIRHFFANQQF